MKNSASGKKRRRSKSNDIKDLSYVSNINVLPCNPKSFSENIFKYKIQSALAHSSILDCYILNNSICVLKLPTVEQYNISKFSYLLDFDDDDVKGKKKKSAIKLQPGSEICQLELSTGEKLVFQAPVGGQLLEINENFVDSPALVNDKTVQNDYVAIIYPNITFPDFTVYDESTSIIVNQLIQGKQGLDRQCFDWVKSRTCSRGSTCKFSHNEDSSSTELPI